MRRTLSAVVLLPVAAAILTACGGASDVAGSIARIKDPREVLAASVQEMNKEAYYLEYALDFPDDDVASGTLVLAQRGSDKAVRVLANDGEFAVFSVAGEGFFCVGGTMPGGSSTIESACYSSDENDDDSTGDLNGFFFDSTSIMDEIAGDKDAEITDAGDRKVAGLDVRCLDISRPGDDAGTICIAKDTGLLVLIEGEFDGEPGRIELVAAREPADSDFKLPYDVVDSPLSLFGSTFSSAGPAAPHVPEKPDRESVPSVRIAGPLLPWETTPALCPDFEVDKFASKIAAYPGGRILLEGSFSVVMLDTNCETGQLNTDAWTFDTDRNGNVIIVDESGFDGAKIVRIGASGTKTVVAGRACKPRGDCDQHPDGPALDVVLGSVWAVAASDDGTIWFTEWALSADEFARLRRITPGGRVETVDTGLAKEIWEMTGGPGDSLVVVVDFGDAYLLSADGTLTRLQLTGDSCFATAPDGTIWSYDFVDGTLIATLPGSGAKAFPFQPERDFDCASLAIEESGDLLLLSANWGTPAGLWRIPNPLVSR